MRTEEQFAIAYKQAKWFVNFHKKNVWLVPTEDDYRLSVVKPTSVPKGTTAIQYDPNMDIVEEYPIKEKD